MAYLTNKCVICGYVTKPDIRYTAGNNPTAVARFSVGVNTGGSVDFIPCISYGKTAEFIGKYIEKGNAVSVVGRIQTGCYTNRDGVKIYTTEVVVEDFSSEKNGALNLNCVILIGRLTRDPEIRHLKKEGGDDETVCIARYTLACNRKYAKEKDSADFISCVAFGKNGDFAAKHLHKGTAVGIRGRLKSSSYTNKEGKKVYTVEVLPEEQRFADKKKTSSDKPESAGGEVPSKENNPAQNTGEPDLDGFTSLPEGDQDEFDTLKGLDEFDNPFGR